MSSEPDHPVLAEPWTYELVAMHWKLDPRDDRDDYLDLTLRRGAEVRKLRFVRPQNIKIDQGFHGTLNGFVILDISNRQWDNLRVEVINFEQDPGITFVASHVIDFDSTTDT